MGEYYLSMLLCGFLNGGQAEARVFFPVISEGSERHVRADCITDTHVIEVGLDRPSSRDSIHQAIYAAKLTGLEPLVVILDTDRNVGRTEIEVAAVATEVGVGYVRCPSEFLITWAANRGRRDVAPDALGDLPSNERLAALCPIEAALENGHGKVEADRSLVDPQKGAIAVMPLVNFE